MTEIPYFERLKDVLDGLERGVYDDENFWEYSLAIIDLKYEALIKDISLNPEQFSFIRNHALEHLKIGTKSEFHTLCSILAYTGYDDVEAAETSLTHHFDLKEGRPRPDEIAIRLLLDAGVFESGEVIRYYDVGIVGFQKKDVGRQGLIILTDRRIIAVGGYSNGSSSKRHKLFYGQLREPYLSTVDFIYLDRVKDIELKKDEIKMKYDTEYIIEKDRTFYGPYFFKFDLPTSVKVKSGSIQVFIKLPDLEKRGSGSADSELEYWNQAMDKWNEVEMPKGYDKSRLRVLYDRLVNSP